MSTVPYYRIKVYLDGNTKWSKFRYVEYNSVLCKYTLISGDFVKYDCPIKAFDMISIKIDTMAKTYMRAFSGRAIKFPVYWEIIECYDDVVYASAEDSPLEALAKFSN